MIETVAIATDGSESVRRCIDVAVDLAERFEAEVHALYVVDEAAVESAPDDIRADLQSAYESDAETALERVTSAAGGAVRTSVETGRPADAIADYAREHDVDVVATGTRGRHGEHRFLLGSVAERVVRRCPVPVLTVRQLDGEE